KNTAARTLSGRAAGIAQDLAVSLRLHPLLRRAVAEDRVDPLDELPRAERLRDVVVRSDLEAHLLVDVAALRGEQDDRHVLGLRVRLQALARLVAVQL